MDIMPHGTTINYVAYVATLKKLQARLRRVRAHRQKKKIVLHHNARTLDNHKTIIEIRKLGWIILKHPPYKPYLTPCDYLFFGKLKESLRRTRFEDDDSLMNAINNSSDVTGTDRRGSRNIRQGARSTTPWGYIRI